MCRDYGHYTRNVLQIAAVRGWCTQDSLTEYLGTVLAAANCEPVSRAMVASWYTGRENMPADAFARFLEHIAPHTAEALDAFARPLACRAEEVVTPNALDDDADALTGAVAEVQALLVAAGAHRSEHGPRFSPGELAGLYQPLRRLIVASLRVLAHASIGLLLLPFGRRTV